MQIHGLHLSRSVTLTSGQDITVTLRRRDQWSIELIDLETIGVADIELPAGGPYDTEQQALQAASEIAEKALG